MNTTQTKNFCFRNITENDAHHLQRLTMSHDKARHVFGSGITENLNVAKAFGADKVDYPVAALVCSKGSKNVVGAVVARKVDTNAADLSIFASNAKDYLEILMGVQHKLSGHRVFVSPTKEVVDSLDKALIVAKDGCEITIQF